MVITIGSQFDVVYGIFLRRPVTLSSFHAVSFIKNILLRDLRLFVSKKDLMFIALVYWNFEAQTNMVRENMLLRFWKTSSLSNSVRLLIDFMDISINSNASLICFQLHKVCS